MVITIAQSDVVVYFRSTSLIRRGVGVGVLADGDEVVSGLLPLLAFGTTSLRGLSASVRAAAARDILGSLLDQVSWDLI